MDNRSHPHESLAIAYLTGQATEDEQRQYQSLLARDAEFRALVGELELWLAPLNTAAPEVAPPAGLLDDIMAGIDTQQPRKSASAPAAKKARQPAVFWRPLAIAASFIAVASTALHFVPEPAAPAPEAEKLALLAGEEAPRVVVIVYDPGEQKVLATLSNMTLPEDGVWQLWLIRDGEAGPQSLGLFDQAVGEDGQIELILDQALLPGTDTMAISLEPTGGSPEPTPPGPVLFTSKVMEL